MSQNRLLSLTEIAIFTALAVVLDRLTLFTMPQGGSVTLAMLPIFIIAFRRGGAAGLLCGFLVGLIQLIFGGYFLNLFQVALDYLLAYAAVGLAGFFRSGKQAPGLPALLLGGLLSGLARFASHFLSGIIFYGEYAPEGTPVWIYSLIYNGSFMVPCALIALLALVIIYKARPSFFAVN